MTDADPTTGFQLEAEGIDTDLLEEELHTRSQARKAAAEARGLDSDGLAQGFYPLPAEAVFSRDLYEALHQASYSCNKVNVEMDLTETRLPIVGGLVHRLRAAMHELVLFYVSRLGARQARFNEQTARALVTLVQDLETEVRDLRARLAELEADRGR
jgi:hypothetical protein